ncbi:glycosyltransferase [Mycolicibacterium iranicum]|uniref:glycosyltransferase n=1 Tax=Mycolicibacterium iranicum TaxID=912594 RepID=UPI0009DB7FFA|nr:glycosyltransferase [Mycolicibacterium iranicum]
MKLLIDVIGGPPGSGGTELHAREVLEAWIREFPNDEVVVVGTKWPDLSDLACSRVRWIFWPTNSVLMRIIGQMIFIPLVMQLYRRHVLLVSLAVLSPLCPKRRSFVFSHDWRHLTRPEEFSRVRRLYRSIWRRSVKRATRTFCVSPKALRETANVSPSASVMLAENGHDHASRWDISLKQSCELIDAIPADSRTVVTYGHWNNKRPELVVNALAMLESGDPVHLIVLGARGEYRETLRELAKRNGIDSVVHLPGFVPGNEYRTIISQADCVVIASTDEGFGFPVVEALYFGHPVVVTADSGLVENFGNLVISANPDAAGIALAIGEGLRRKSVPIRQSMHRWCDTVITVREGIESSFACVM